MIILGTPLKAGKSATRLKVNQPGYRRLRNIQQHPGTEVPESTWSTLSTKGALNLPYLRRAVLEIVTITFDEKANGMPLVPANSQSFTS